jgi:hypothetical protein
MLSVRRNMSALSYLARMSRTELIGPAAQARRWAAVRGTK